MTDLTNVFAEGMRSAEGYNHFKIIRQIKSLEGILCDTDDDGANWDVIWTLINRKTEIYAFFSRMYPVALIKQNCPESVLYMLKKCGVLITLFDSIFSCDAEILKQYAPDRNILDDSFLDDCNFSLDDERLYYIYERIPYITPYSFTFDEIR